jgi:dCMP deaminase
MREIDKELFEKISKASNLISLKFRRSGASWMVTSAALSSTFEELFKSERIRDSREKKINNLLKMNDKQLRYDITYLKMAKDWSELSHCDRKKVGALIVKNGMIISDGYNGTPSGYDNCCENENWETHWYTIHAESNAILKCARWGHSCDGATLYLTHSPCKDCSKSVLQSGIRRVVYIEDYKDLEGVNFLTNSGIQVEKISI